MKHGEVGLVYTKLGLLHLWPKRIMARPEASAEEVKKELHPGEREMSLIGKTQEPCPDQRWASGV